MNHPPRYPAYADPRPVHWRRWWIALPVVLFLAAMGTMLLWPAGKPTRTPAFWFWGLVLPFLFWLTALALRWMVWLQSLSNRDTHRETIAASLSAWWQQRSRNLPVEAVVLVTPQGDEEADHTVLLALPLPDAPQYGSDAEGNTLLRCSLVLGMQDDRPVLLARYLARQLLKRLRDSHETRGFRVFCWLGDEPALTAFMQVLESDGIRLPEEVLRLRDTMELDAVINAMPGDEDALLLCAGYGEGDVVPERIAAEAAFAWLCGYQAKAQMHRAESLLPEDGDTAPALVAQLARYSQLQSSPEVVLAADRAAMEALLPCGWSAVDCVLTPWVGDCGSATPFVMQSLAALAALNGQPCGWTASLTESQFITGVCVPRGNHPY